MKKQLLTLSLLLSVVSMQAAVPAMVATELGIAGGLAAAGTAVTKGIEGITNTVGNITLREPVPGSVMDQIKNGVPVSKALANGYQAPKQSWTQSMKNAASSVYNSPTVASCTKTGLVTAGTAYAAHKAINKLVSEETRKNHSKKVLAAKTLIPATVGGAYSYFKPTVSMPTVISKYIGLEALKGYASKMGSLVAAHPYKTAAGVAGLAVAGLGLNYLKNKFYGSAVNDATPAQVAEVPAPVTRQVGQAVDVKTVRRAQIQRIINIAAASGIDHEGHLATVNIDGKLVDGREVVALKAELAKLS